MAVRHAVRLPQPLGDRLPPRGRVTPKRIASRAVYGHRGRAAVGLPYSRAALRAALQVHAFQEPSRFFVIAATLIAVRVRN